MKPSDKLFLAAYRANIPLTLIFELTRDCNLACRHCYIPPADRKLKNLPTEKIKQILRSAARAGAMYAIFTGGEIFLRRDVFEIIDFAKNLRFDVRLFTNATLLDAKKIRRIAVSGVSAIETSMYGGVAAHDFITRSAGSHAKTVRAIDGLLESGIQVVVKTPLMKLNYACIRYVQRFAARRKIKCRFDPTISPADDGGKENLALRLDGRMLESVYRRFGHAVPASCLSVAPHPGVRQKRRRPSAARERLLECSAARSLAAVSADGELYPCPQLRVSAGNLLEKDFAVLWRGPTFEYLRKAFLPSDSNCSNCAHLPYCQRCPGLALVEDGSIFSPPSEACKLSGIRRLVAVSKITSRH